MSKWNKGGSYWRVAAHLATIITFVIFVYILVFNSEFAENFHQQLRELDYMARKPPAWLQGSQELKQETSGKVGALLDQIRGLTRLASDVDGLGYSLHLTAKERAAWNAQYPCQSRAEMPQIYASRKHIEDISTNPHWDQVLDEYSNLHRVCMKRVGNLTDYFLNKSNVTIPGCKFLIGEGTNGLGNKLLVTISAVLYAIVTQRVLLVPARTDLGSLLCEPFTGSSWIFDDSTFPMPDGADKSWNDSHDNGIPEKVSARMELLKDEKKSGSCTHGQCENLPPLVDALVVAAGWWGQNWQPKQWFYCNTEQNLLSAVPWVYLSGCIYTVPKMFGSPAFKSTFKALFPDHMVLTRLLRSTALPSNTVWSRLKHVNHAYFSKADRQVAIQLRFFQHSHDKMKSVMNKRIVDCMLNNSILPNVIDLEATSSTDHGIARNSTPPETSITVVLITSLYVELHDRLSEFYLRNPTVTGEDVRLVQLTNHMQQSKGLDEDSEAFVEVLLLSFSDVLLVTPVSTFGGLGEGYGGLLPWFMRTSSGDDADLPSCVRGQTVDTCQQGGNLDYDCPHDTPYGELVLDQKPRPLIGKCLSIDADGIQVLNS